MLRGLSVVVPFRNEADNLPRLIDSINNAKTRLDLAVEFIFVNDHSTDHSKQCVDNAINSILITSRGNGKKAALKDGVLAAKYEWILTLDADVVLPQSFFNELSILPLNNLKMLILPVRPKRRRGMVPAFFDLEFLALQGVGLGMADKGMPLLSSGACLLFEKLAFQKVNDRRADYQIRSGDDIFNMFAVAHEYGEDSIGVGLSVTPVQTAFPKGLTQLFRQRSRWISKTTEVPNFRYKFTAFSMAAIHLLPLVLALAFFVDILPLHIVLSLLAIKWGGEWIFFWYFTRAFDRNELIYFIPIAQLVYPFYIFALIVGGLVDRLRYRKPNWDAA